MTKQPIVLCRTLLVLLFAIPVSAKAQPGSDLIRLLQSINRTVASNPCNDDSAAAISNRAMNVFLADKIGYLPGPGDLSYYTNYAAFNTSEGKLSVNHNFQPATSNDAPLQHFFSFGLDMTIANSYAKSFLDKRFENELGISFQYTLNGKVKTRFRDCGAMAINQKQRMDALRTALVQQLAMEIRRKEADFKLGLQDIDSASLPGQDPAVAKTIMQEQFDEALAAASTEQFVTRQAALLTASAAFRVITTHWTSAGLSVPLFFPNYLIAATLVTAFSTHHPYPLSFTVSHTRLWESGSMGRLFFALKGSLLLSNSKLIYGLNKLSYNEYRAMGGTGTLAADDPANDKIYIGSFRHFLSPSVAARVVYFPVRSHVGISLLAEQHAGYYHCLNAKLGVPVILVNHNSTPTLNIECYLLVFDLAHQAVLPVKRGNTSLGISFGIPFSRLMY